MIRPVRPPALVGLLVGGLLICAGCGSGGTATPTARPSDHTGPTSTASAAPTSSPTSPNTAPSSAGSAARTSGTSTSGTGNPGTKSSGPNNSGTGESTTKQKNHKKELPPPAEPTAPAPKTAGELTKSDMPHPAGWKPVARKGGAEQGYQGNGTWVQGRDPRYAARDAISVGCADISRNDYPDPTAALQATYGKRGNLDTPGIGLLLQFGSHAEATAYYDEYVKQVRACDDPDGQLVAKVVPSDLGLIDHRIYSDGTAWTEMVGVHGKRVTQVILTDPDRQIGKTQAEAVIRQFG